jgi:hypothetical protein
MYYCFCDDFQRDYTFAHIIFGAKEPELHKIVKFVKDCKVKLDINQLHCRVLFNNNSREKQYPFLTDINIYRLYYEILKFIIEIDNVPRPLLSYAHHTQAEFNQIKLIKSLDMNDINDNFIYVFKIQESSY